MANVNFKIGSADKVKATPIENGSFLVDKENKTLSVDYGNERLSLSGGGNLRKVAKSDNRGVLRLDDVGSGTIKIENKNLIPFPWGSSSTEGWKDETTWVDDLNDPNVQITVNDKDDYSLNVQTLKTEGLKKQIQFNLFTQVELEVGELYTLSGFISGSTGDSLNVRLGIISHDYQESYYLNDSGQTLTITPTVPGRKYYCFILLRQDAKNVNAVFKPQLERGSEATEFHRYNPNLFVKMYGKNLLQWAKKDSTTTKDGMTYTVDAQKGLAIVNGTPTKETNLACSVKDFSSAIMKKGYGYYFYTPNVRRVDDKLALWWEIKTEDEESISIQVDTSKWETDRKIEYFYICAESYCPSTTSWPFTPQIEIGHNSNKFEAFKEPVTIKANTSASAYFPTATLLAEDDTPFTVIYTSDPNQLLHLSTDDNSDLQLATLGKIEASFKRDSGISFNDSANIAGAMGYTLKQDSSSYDVANRTYTLETTTMGWEVGDRISAIFNNSHDDFALIQSITQNASTKAYTIKVDKFITPAEDTDPWIIWVSKKPLAGNTPVGRYQMALGRQNIANAEAAFAEGRQNIADGKNSHAEGRQNYAGYATHAEGRGNVSKGLYSHTEGLGNRTNEQSAHAEGEYTYASGKGAHVEGGGIQVTDSDSLTGYSPDLNYGAKGTYSHAEGYATTAVGKASHAGGTYTIANREAETAIGKYNEPNPVTIKISGNNTDWADCGSNSPKWVEKSGNSVIFYQAENDSYNNTVTIVATTTNSTDSDFRIKPSTKYKISFDFWYSGNSVVNPLVSVYQGSQLSYVVGDKIVLYNQ